MPEIESICDLVSHGAGNLIQTDCITRPTASQIWSFRPRGTSNPFITSPDWIQGFRSMARLEVHDPSLADGGMEQGQG